MADQDFQITIRTIADTTGIKLTQVQLEALQKAAAQGNQQAINALKQLSAAQKEAAASASIGFGGAAVGVGTIVTLLTGAISKWKQFNDEQDRFIDKMLEATAKMREQALAVAEIKDLDFSQELIDQSQSTEELAANVDRLKQKIAVLKAEQDALDPLTQANEWKALRAEIQAYTSQLNSATSAIDRNTAAEEKNRKEKEKAAEQAVKDQESFFGGAVAGASPQTQAALRNEEAARKAREAGDEKSAAQFQKSADQLKASMSEAERQEYGQLTEPLHARKAGPGESQEAIDQIERNRINFERQQRGEAPLPAGPGLGANPALQAAIEKAFSNVMQRYWGGQ